MLKKLTSLIFSTLVLSITACSDNNTTTAQSSSDLKIFNWTDYVDPSTVKEFEDTHQIKVNYSYYDSDEALEAKVLSGNSGYDLVGPSNVFAGRQIKAGAYLKLDKSQIPNYHYINNKVLTLLDSIDPNNDYLIPYVWGSNTLAIDVDKVTELLGGQLPEKLWDLAFNPEYTSKLKSCGVTYLDSPTEMYPLVLNYLGYSPETTDLKEIQAATEVFKANRNNLKRFVSSGVVDGMARGDICVGVGFSSDLHVAKKRAIESGNGINIKVLLPKEGVGIWVDNLAIPKDAVNVENAYKYINHTLDPVVAAKNGEFVSIAPASAPAKDLMSKELTEDPTVFAPQENLEKSFILQPIDLNVLKIITRDWQNLKLN